MAAKSVSLPCIDILAHFTQQNLHGKVIPTFPQFQAILAESTLDPPTKHKKRNNKEVVQKPAASNKKAKIDEPVAAPQSVAPLIIPEKQPPISRALSSLVNEFFDLKSRTSNPVMDHIHNQETELFSTVGSLLSHLCSSFRNLKAVFATLTIWRDLSMVRRNLSLPMDFFFLIFLLIF
jgi:hypothetical protein